MESALATVVKSVATWVPGAVVGRFTLLAKLATGGMAEIWLARQAGLQGFEKVVVIKRIIESFSGDRAFVEMFLDEARIAAQLNHPNIVQVHDLGEFAGAYYIAMEYLPGEHVAAVARAAIAAKAPLGFSMSVKLAVAALDGLAHAHTRVGVNGKPLEVVHRDVSPQNILVTYDGQVKLVDFGIAKAANRSVQTQSGQLKGKFAYMAPEQARARSVDARADLFSVGVVLYELLSHKRMWAIDDQIELLASLIGPEPIDDVRERNPEVPEALAAIVMKAVAKNVALRWQDAVAFKAALEDWLRANGGAPTNTELSTLMQQLFGQRMARRTQLIEQANRGDLTPIGAGEVLKPPTERSMPGATPVGFASPSGKWVLGLVGTLAALGVLMLAWVGNQYLQAQKPTVIEIPATPPVLLVGPAEVVVQSDPPSAKLSLDGKPIGVAPMTISPVEPGEHLLVASLAGYDRLTRTVNVARAGDRVLVVLTLQPEPLPADPTPVAAPVAPVGKDPAPAPAAKGRLTLSTDPWTHVFEGGKPLGDTPLVDLPLPAGRHQLHLVNDDQKVNLNIEVEVKAGQLTKKQLKL